MAAVGAVLRDCTGGDRPAVLVLIEVEDATVVDDVVGAAGWPQLASVAVPGEKLDGWDVAVAYDPAVFPTGVAEARSYVFSNRFATRDLLVADLRGAAGRRLTVAATHWPSRSVSESQPLRFAAAANSDRILELVLKYPKEDLLSETGRARLPARARLLERWRTPLLVAGDLNDEPWDPTVRAVRYATPDLDAVTRAPRLPTGKSLRSVTSYLSLRARLFNPTWLLPHDARAPGTYYYDGEWHRLDQFLVSSGALAGDGPRLVPGSLRVHAPRSVVVGGRDVAVSTPSGIPIGFDAGKGHGVSDHLPLVADFEF